MDRSAVSRLLHTISLGRITLLDDTASIQTLQVRERPGSDGSPALTNGVLRVAEFGFVSNPPTDADVILVRLWGNRTLTIALGTNHQPSRLKNLQPGDTAIHDVRGAKVYLGPNGIVIDGAGQGLPVTIQNAPNVTIECPTTIDGALTVNGPVQATGDVIAGYGTTPVSLENLLT